MYSVEVLLQQLEFLQITYEMDQQMVKVDYIVEGKGMRKESGETIQDHSLLLGDRSSKTKQSGPPLLLCTRRCVEIWNEREIISRSETSASGTTLSSLVRAHMSLHNVEGNY